MAQTKRIIKKYPNRRLYDTEISSYITKKVSDRLQSLFKNDRKEFEQKWDDIKIFINYGMLTQDDFYDKALEGFTMFALNQGEICTCPSPPAPSPVPWRAPMWCCSA